MLPIGLPMHRIELRFSIKIHIHFHSMHRSQWNSSSFTHRSHEILIGLSCFERLRSTVFFQRFEKLVRNVDQFTHIQQIKSIFEALD